MKAVTFLVGDYLCGADVGTVQEVLRKQDVRPVPLAGKETPGLLHLRGQILTAIDMRAAFGIATGVSGGASGCVVVREGEGIAGLLVDRIGEVVPLEDSGIAEPPAHWQGPVRKYLRGVIDRGGQLLLLLDIALLLAIESVPAETGAEEWIA